MGTANMRIRETELLETTFREMQQIPDLHVLADSNHERLGIISFYIKDIHFNLAVKLLNDKFGIQVRGGCACAGTYGHYLLDVSYDKSHYITSMISSGDLSQKPGWIRLSLHPTMTDRELLYILDAIKQVQKHHKKWSDDYVYNRHSNEFRHKNEPENKMILVKDWFDL